MKGAGLPPVNHLKITRANIAKANKMTAQLRPPKASSSSSRMEIPILSKPKPRRSRIMVPIDSLAELIATVPPVDLHIGQSRIRGTNFIVNMSFMLYVGLLLSALALTQFMWYFELSSLGPFNSVPQDLFEVEDSKPRFHVAAIVMGISFLGEVQMLLSAQTSFKIDFCRITTMLHMFAFLTYLTNTAEVIPYLLNRFSRPALSTRHISWITILPILGLLFVLTTGRQIDADFTRQLTALNLTVIILGVIAELASSSIVALLAFCGACLALLASMTLLRRILGTTFDHVVKGNNMSHDAVQRVESLFVASLWVVCIIFCTFPIVFVAAAYDQISFRMEMELYAFLDCFAVIFFTSSLHYNFCQFLDYAERRRTIHKRMKQEMLMSVTTQRREFLTYILQEIRDPLKTISTNVDAFVPVSIHDVKKVNQVFEKTQKCVDNIVTLLDDILYLHNMESAGLELKIRPMSISRLFPQLLKMFDKQVRKKNLHVNVKMDSFPVLLGDIQQLSQVIATFLSNAIKFSKHNGTITLVARCLTVDKRPVLQRSQRRVLHKTMFSPSSDDMTSSSNDVSDDSDDDGGARRRELREVVEVYISVEDEGHGVHGMTANDEAKLFKPYVTMEDPFNERTKDTTLSLCVCENIVELCDGQIGLKHPPDHPQHAEFWVQIPLEVCPCDEAKHYLRIVPSPLALDRYTKSVQRYVSAGDSHTSAPTSAQEVTVSLSDAEISKLRVLVVYENNDRRKVLLSNIRKRIENVDVVTNGLLCINQLKSTASAYDIILLDHDIKEEMTALETVVYVRGNGEMSVIIGLANHEKDVNSDDLVKAGVNTVLRKPSTFEHIIFAYKAVLQQQMQITEEKQYKNTVSSTKKPAMVLRERKTPSPRSNWFAKEDAWVA